MCREEKNFLKTAEAMKKDRLAAVFRWENSLMRVSL